MVNIFYRMVFLVLVGLLIPGCSVKPNILPEHNAPNYFPKANYDKIVVSNFFKTTFFSGLRVEQMPYYDTENYTYWQKSGQDISGLVSQHLGSEGIKTRAMKNFPSTRLKKGELLVSGVVSINNIPDVSPLKVIPFFILIGNVLPNPVGFTSGANIHYRYEIIDHNSNIIYQSGRKRFKVAYKHYWVWGSIFKRDQHYDEGSEKAMNIVMDEIVHIAKGLKQR